MTPRLPQYHLSAATYGGGVYVNAAARFENCIFNGNSSTFRGGAVFNDAGNAVFANCHFTANTSPATSAAVHSQGTLSFVNCLMWGNSTKSLVGTSGTSTLTNCLVEGGLVTGFSVVGTLQTADPLFANSADADGPDNIWATPDDGLFPQALSPTRDTGTASGAPVVDIRGVARPSGNGHDLGCYERRVAYIASAGAGSGSSWADPAGDLRLTLLSSSAGDEIWVRAGTYKPTSGTDETLSFAVPAEVGLYGGFSGSETTRDARNWAGNRVTLSGEINTGANTDNSWHVVTAGNGAVIDGFIITAGNADGTWGTDDACGGGLFVRSASPTIRNCVFLANQAGYEGGAISLWLAHPRA